MSSHLKAELAATCSTLGRLHKGEYLIEPECIESVKDLIRYLKRDDEAHEIRRYLGECKVLQNDLIYIAKSCPQDMPELFDVTLRLLINLTTPTMIFYGEEMPAEKIGRNIYLSLIGYNQDYKIAFCDVEFWNKVCGKLTNFFEVDWTERSADDGIQIERMLMLLRNILHIPADVEYEKRPENDITIHDKVLWALRQSQILELLLFVAANENEEQYYLNLLEIFSLILREQNPKWLAHCDIRSSTEEKNKDTIELARVRESEKRNQNKYLNMRNFNATYVMKGVKSLSNNDVICHKSLDKVNDLNVNQNKKQIKARRDKIPIESERKERRSTFTVRLFLKEFCLEFLNNGFGNLMNVVKNRLDSGKSLAHDQTYYFWALKFFLDFTIASNLDVALIKHCLSMESFHFVQTSMESAFEHLLAEKKKTVDWVKRIHLILKAYHSLLETLLWMDCSKDPLVRSVSREIKSELFYVVEYREMTLHVLLKYDSTKFSVSYLRDLIETTHLFVKLLEEYSKQTKLVVQKLARKRSSKKKSKVEEEEVETNEQKWEKIKDDVYDILSSENLFPEIPPFDAALDIPIDDQKGRAMKNIQKLLHKGEIRESIGLLRSSRQVWPENDYFGSEGMSVEDECMALQEICLADFGVVEEEKQQQINDNGLENENEEDDDEEEEEQTHVVEQDFNIMDYKKRLVNKKVVEGCGVLLKNYKKNSDHTNHCVIKLLHRIGWECCMPAMLYQASLFWTLLQIMNDKTRVYTEINTFTMNLMRKFRKDASKNPVVFLELLFWKENNVALEIQHGYEPYEDKEKPKKRTKKKKGKDVGEIFSGDEEVPIEGVVKKSRGRRKKTTAVEGMEGIELDNISSDKPTKRRPRKKKEDTGENGVKKRTRKKKSVKENEDLPESQSTISESLMEDKSDYESTPGDKSELFLDRSEDDGESDNSDQEEVSTLQESVKVPKSHGTDNSEDETEPVKKSLNFEEDENDDIGDMIARKYKKHAGLLDDNDDEVGTKMKSNDLDSKSKLNDEDSEKEVESLKSLDDISHKQKRNKIGKSSLKSGVLTKGSDIKTEGRQVRVDSDSKVESIAVPKHKKRVAILEDSSEDENESEIIKNNTQNSQMDETEEIRQSSKEKLERNKHTKSSLKSRVLTDSSDSETEGRQVPMELSVESDDTKSSGVSKYKKLVAVLEDSSEDENESLETKNNKEGRMRNEIKETPESLDGKFEKNKSEKASLQSHLMRKDSDNEMEDRQVPEKLSFEGEDANESVVVPKPKKRVTVLEDSSEDESVETKSNTQGSKREEIEETLKSPNEKFERLTLDKLTGDSLGKDSDLSNDSSRFSDASSKKRGREENKKLSNHTEDVSDDSDNSRLKRRRFIGSDSDMGDFNSDDEGPVLSRKNKKRAAIIDSDSDLEGHNSLDEK